MFKRIAIIVVSVSLVISALVSALPGRAEAAAAARLEPGAWQRLAIVPALSARARAIYRQGLALGNNPRAFSKAGDGEVAAPWFLTTFDLSPTYYSLGDHADLQTTIDYFTGSLGRHSQAARAGFNTTSLLTPALADHTVCLAGETPLACELRLHHPSFVIISLGTNQVWAPQVLEPELRQIVEYLIGRGVVPILSTKGDNLEGDYRINSVIAQIAADYDVPLWNFWRAIQPLPSQGLQRDHEHLTWAPDRFDLGWTMERAWPVRNLTALQTLQALQQATAN